MAGDTQQLPRWSFANVASAIGLLATGYSIGLATPTVQEIVVVKLESMVQTAEHIDFTVTSTIR